MVYLQQILAGTFTQPENLFTNSACFEGCSSFINSNRFWFILMQTFLPDLCSALMSSSSNIQKSDLKTQLNAVNKCVHKVFCVEI